MDHAMALPMHEQPRTKMGAWMATPPKAVFQRMDSEDVERADTARVRSLEVLAASMVQELDQPLSALVASAEACLRMLSPQSLNLQGAHDQALHTLQDARRAAAVIERMWSLFAKTAGNSDPVDLNDTVKAALLLSSQKLQQRRVTVRRELEPDLPPITGDSLQLQQVILNLVTNAAEAMDDIHERPRELVVRTQSGEGHVRLSVRDAGPGFEPRDADRLFDAFYTTKADGMGVGLFVSRWIIENHRGAISAALNDGPGATFSFLIPCRKT